MQTKLRYQLFIILLILIPLGLLTKWESWHQSSFLVNYAGGIVYVLFFILLVKFITPGFSSLAISIWVTAVTCLLEFSQLLSFPFLEAVRSTFPGRTLLGSHFNPADFPYYLIGGALGFLTLKILERSMTTSRK